MRSGFSGVEGAFRFGIHVGDGADRGGGDCVGVGVGRLGGGALVLDRGGLLERASKRCSLLIGVG